MDVLVPGDDDYFQDLLGDGRGRVGGEVWDEVELGKGGLLLGEVVEAATAAGGEADGEEEEGEDEEGAEEDANDDPKTEAEYGGLLGELGVDERGVVYGHALLQERLLTIPGKKERGGKEE